MPPVDLAELLNLARYPGRFAGEHEVIGDWLRARGHLYDRIEFNVPVGVGVGQVDGLVPPYDRMAEQLSRKRVDLVAWLPAGVILIEAKGRATSDALGQLMSYRPLWELDRPDVPVVGLEVICRRINADDLAGMLSNGVDVRVYERAADN